MAKSKITNAQIAKVYKAQLGNVSATAKALNMGRRTLYDRMEKDKALEALMQEVDESNKDFGEGQLRKLMTGFEEDDLFIAQYQGEIIEKKIKKVYPPNLGAVCFYLKTQAKDRGYIERSEVEHSVYEVFVDGEPDNDE